MDTSSRLYPFGGIPIFHLFGISFSLNYIVNTGAAWGFFSGHPSILFAIRIAIISGFASYLLFFQKGEGLPKFPVWLILTGAIGNAIDYVLYGYVIDFFHFTFWGYSFPIFNFADSYITLGVIGLLFSKSTEKTSQSL
jgi:signal peptidase II